MQNSSSAIGDLVKANHILANEDVLDAFGHVSMRNPDSAGEYLLARAISPEVVESRDILSFTLDSVPVDPSGPASYSERVIHGSLYEARPEIGAVCHFHAQSIMPFCITGQPIVPVSHLCATVGAIRSWSSRDDFGDTNLIVGNGEEGASLARAMGDDWAVLMANHGAVVAGRSLKEMVFRTIQLCRNAAMVLAAQRLGTVEPLTPREIELAGAFNLREPVLDRAWDYWGRRAGAARVAVETVAG